MMSCFSRLATSPHLEHQCQEVSHNVTRCYLVRCAATVSARLSISPLTLLISCTSCFSATCTTQLPTVHCPGVIPQCTHLDTVLHQVDTLSELPRLQVVDTDVLRLLQHGEGVLQLIPDIPYYNDFK